MARGINKVILIGNLGLDPETRYMPDGTPVSTISLATTLTWKDKETGEQKESTEWHRVVYFNRLAEVVKEYLKKGSKIYTEGRLRTRKWMDSDGVDRYTTEIVAGEMQMLDRLNNNNVDDAAQPVPAPQPDNDFDDDIPY